MAATQGFLIEICWFYFFKKFLAESQQQHMRNGARSKQAAPLLQSCRIFLQQCPQGSDPGSALSLQSTAQPNLPAAWCQKCWSFRELQVTTCPEFVLQARNWPILFLPTSQSSAGCAKFNGRCAAAQNCRADVLSEKVLQLNHFFRLEVHIRRIYLRGM